MTHVTCRLTTKNRDQLRNHTFGNRVLATFTFFYFWLLTLSQKKTICNPLAHPTWKCTTLTCQVPNFFLSYWSTEVLAYFVLAFSSTWVFSAPSHGRARRYKDGTSAVGTSSLVSCLWSDYRITDHRSRNHGIVTVDLCTVHTRVDACECRWACRVDKRTIRVHCCPLPYDNQPADLLLAGDSDDIQSFSRPHL